MVPVFLEAGLNGAREVGFGGPEGRPAGGHGLSLYRKPDTFSRT
jgi:hypothetical protein